MNAARNRYSERKVQIKREANSNEMRTMMEIKKEKGKLKKTGNRSNTFRVCKSEHHHIFK
jgi:hypothetical protein